jgi:hypothetical protein
MSSISTSEPPDQLAGRHHHEPCSQLHSHAREDLLRFSTWALLQESCGVLEAPNLSTLPRIHTPAAATPANPSLHNRHNKCSPAPQGDPARRRITNWPGPSPPHIALARASQMHPTACGNPACSEAHHVLAVPPGREVGGQVHHIPLPRGEGVRGLHHAMQSVPKLHPAQRLQGLRVH